MGGLSRRATVIEQQRKEAQQDGRPIFVVDAGDLAWKSGVLAESRQPQQRRKGELLAEAYVLSGIDAMVPGEGDMVLGMDWLEQTVDRHGLPMVAANLQCSGRSPFPPAVVVEREGVTLGFIGVIGVGLGPDDCTVTDPAQALPSTLDELGAVDVVVLLSHQDSQLDSDLVTGFESIDLVINGHSRQTYGTPRPLPGDAVHLGAGSRGKRLGLATLELIPGASGFQVSGGGG